SIVDPYKILSIQNHFSWTTSIVLHWPSPPFSPHPQSFNVETPAFTAMDQTPSLPSKRHRPSPLFNVLPSKHQTPPTVQNVQCWKPTPKIFSMTSPSPSTTALHCRKFRPSSQLT
uniref:Uncharacterized protein n=1 Tax=Cucumis melo TaxID=3656 RepID=A0A9I9DXJ4_CUCME